MCEIYKIYALIAKLVYAHEICTYMLNENIFYEISSICNILYSGYNYNLIYTINSSNINVWTH